MGQCVKCGRQTQHQYQYHSGDYMSSHREYAGPNQERVTTRYNNLQTHNEYLCRRCNYLRDVVISTAMATIWFFIAGAVVVSRIMGNQTATLSIILFLGGMALLCAAAVVYSARKYVTDKRRSDSSAASLLIDRAKKVDPKRCYFTPEEYSKMAPGFPGLFR